MSNYSKHWSRACVSNNQIKKLDENKIYQIEDVEKLKTVFGKYVLTDEDGNKYWTIR